MGIIWQSRAVPVEPRRLLSENQPTGRSGGRRLDSD